MKKVGPNFQDMNRIREWHEAGATPAEISNYVRVKEEAVVIYLDSLNEPKKAKGAKAKAEAQLDIEGS